MVLPLNFYNHVIADVVKGHSKVLEGVRQINDTTRQEVVAIIRTNAHNFIQIVEILLRWELQFQQIFPSLCTGIPEEAWLKNMLLKADQKSLFKDKDPQKVFDIFRKMSPQITALINRAEEMNMGAAVILRLAILAAADRLKCRRTIDSIFIERRPVIESEVNQQTVTAKEADNK